MKQLTKEQELELWERAFKLHKRDIKHCIECNLKLTGMCTNLINAYDNTQNIRYNYSKPLYKISPKSKFIRDLRLEQNGRMWLWDRKPTNRTRYNHYKRVIAELKQEIKERNK